MHPQIEALIEVIKEVSDAPTPEQLEQLHAIIRPRTLLVCSLDQALCSKCGKPADHQRCYGCEHELVFVAEWTAKTDKTPMPEHFFSLYTGLTYVGVVTGPIKQARLVSLNARWVEFYH